MSNRSPKPTAWLTEEQQFFWLMTTAYVLHAVGQLDPAMERKLDSLNELGAGNWKTSVRDAIRFNASFIQRIYALCSEQRNKLDALLFILRGLGCPDAEKRLADFSVSGARGI